MSLNSPAIASVEIDVRIEDGDNIVINGRAFQVCARPAWLDRPRSQPPLFLSDDAYALVQWARSLKENQKMRDGSRDKRRADTEFTPGEAMDYLYGGEPSKERTARWEAVKSELRATNMLGDAGYFRHRLSAVALTSVPTDPEPQIRRLF